MATDFIYEPLAPKEALDAITSKSTAAGFAFSWKDVAPQEHAAGFYVAKAMRKDVLDLIHAHVVSAIKDGQTLKQFQDSLQDKLIEAGWWGKQEMVDPVTGETKLVQLGSPRRLRTIYRTNLRQSYQAGLWQRIELSKVGLPYLRYHTQGDEAVRASHARWNDTVALVDDAFWKTHFPMNGWGCRCYVTQLTPGMVKSFGLRVTGAKEIATKMGPARQARNKRTGIVETQYEGIDPGFAYNPGIARLDHLKALAEAERTFERGAPENPSLPLAKLLRDGTSGPPANVLLLQSMVEAAGVVVASDTARPARMVARLRVRHLREQALLAGVKFNEVGVDLQVDYTVGIPLRLRRLGVAGKVYQALAQRATAKGGALLSDAIVSEAAVSVYGGLLKQGWTVETRSGIVWTGTRYELIKGLGVAKDGDMWYAIGPDGKLAAFPLFKVSSPGAG